MARRAQTRPAQPRAVLPDEPSLVSRAAAGDSSAFQALVEASHSLVHSICARRVSDQDRAIELVQEVFFRVFRSLSRFRGGTSFAAWVTLIAVNRCRDEWRSAEHRLAGLRRPLSAALGVPTPAPLPDAVLMAREDEVLLRRLVHALPARLREPFLMRHQDGLEYSEIAAALKLKEGAVRMRVCRARERLIEAASEVGGA